MTCAIQGTLRKIAIFLFPNQEEWPSLFVALTVEENADDNGTEVDRRHLHQNAKQRRCEAIFRRFDVVGWTFLPHCGGLRSTELKGTSHRSGLYQCNECRGQFTITTKTPMHATKLDLRIWIAAIYTVLNSSKGISSVVLARLVGINQKAAWKIGHAIREMMREGHRDLPALAGIVEVDETYVGGAPKYKKGVKNKRGKGTKKTPVMVAVERGGEARAAVLTGISGTDFEPLIGAWVAPDSTLMTDGSQTYNSIGSAFGNHLKVKHSEKHFADYKTGAHINTAEAFSHLWSAPGWVSITGLPATIPSDILMN